MILDSKNLTKEDMILFGKWKEINPHSSEAEIQLMIDELMSCVELYVTHPKPRGYGGAPVINDCTSSMLCGFEALGRCGRMDVVSDILDKLIEGKEHLKGPDYCMWIAHIQRCVDGFRGTGNFAKVFSLNSRAFQVYFENERATPNQIVRIAEGLKDADENLKKQFEQMAVEYKGAVYGLYEALYKADDFGFDDEGEVEDNSILNAIKNMQ